MLLGAHHLVAGQIAVDELHLAKGQQQDPVVAATGDAAQGLGDAGRIRQRLARQLTFWRKQPLDALQRLVHPFAGDRLEQVVEGVLLKRAQGKLVVGGDEDDVGAQVRVQHAHQLQPADARHLDVEKQQVGFEAMDGGQRLHGVGALSQQADIARLLQQQPQLLAGEGFIVDDQGGQHGLSCRGRVILTRVD